MKGVTSIINLYNLPYESNEIVKVSDTGEWFQFVRESRSFDNGTDIIRPRRIPETRPGRWIKFTTSGGISGPVTWEQIQNKPQLNALTSNIVFADHFKQPGDVSDVESFERARDYIFQTSSQEGIIGALVKDYTFHRPLILAKFSVSGTYQPFNIEIRGGGNTMAGVAGQCTRIICTHKNTFAIGLQNARGSTISNVLIQGARVDSKTNKQIFEGESWVIADVRDTQYSPYAGVVIDPFGPTLPEDGGYPGLSDYYKATAGGSSGVTLDWCHITNFTVDFLISPNGQTPNAEGITVSNCRLYLSKIPYASGQSQTRTCILSNIHIFQCLDAVNTVAYGAGTGSPPIIDGLGVSKCRNVFNVSTARAMLSAMNVYAEDIYRIGIFSGPKIAYIGGVSTFKFVAGGADAIKAPDSLITATGGPVILDGCDLTKPGDTNWNAYLPPAVVLTGKTQFDGLHIPHGGCEIETASVFGFNVGSGNRLTGASPAPFYNYNGSTIKKTLNTSGNLIQHHIKPAGNFTQSIQSNVTVTVSGSEATFDLSSVSRVQVGDIIYTNKSGYYFLDYSNSNSATTTPDTRPLLGTVKSIVGNTVTIKDIRIGIETGDYNLFNEWSVRYTGAIIGSFTNGSNIITNVYRESSASLVGQRIHLANPQTGSLLGVYITGEDQNARTLTLSENAGFTLAKAFIYTAYFEIEAVISGTPGSNAGIYYDAGTIIKSRPDKLYICSEPGIVSNVTHSPVFKEISSV